MKNPIVIYIAFNIPSIICIIFAGLLALKHSETGWAIAFLLAAWTLARDVEYRDWKSNE